MTAKMKESKRTVSTDVFQLCIHMENVHSGSFHVVDKSSYIRSVLEKIKALGTDGLVEFDLNRIAKFSNLYK